MCILAVPPVAAGEHFRQHMNYESRHSELAHGLRPWLITPSALCLALFVAGQCLLFVVKTPPYEFRFTHSRFAVIRFNQNAAIAGYFNTPGWDIRSYASHPFYVEFIPHIRDVPMGNGAIIGKAILLPMTIPLLLLLAFTIWSIIVGKKKRCDTRCAKCDYSLIGNTSGMCPECGVAVKRIIGS